MPKISQDNVEQTEKPFSDQLKAVGHMQVEPMMVCGVNRKVNIGNYENIDVYIGVSLPIEREAMATTEDLRSALAEAARIGVGIASAETYQRYQAIKGEPAEEDPF